MRETGYAFSEEEGGVRTKEELIRRYDSARAQPRRRGNNDETVASVGARVLSNNVNTNSGYGGGDVNALIDLDDNPETGPYYYPHAGLITQGEARPE